jgi:hypothetical protein
MKQDWSVFVHLNDPVLQAPIAQRDMYPGQGLRATSLMQPGETILNRYAIRLPETAVAPSDLSLNVGLYDFSTGRRLKSEEGIDSVELTQMDLQAIPGSVPNPVTINFENELELVGYDLDNRYIEPGEEINLNLYWRAYDRPEEDYTFFAQLLDSDTTRWASQDIQTQTSNWEEGDLQIVTIQMTVAQDAPSGVYPIIVGAYTRPVEGGFERLQHVIDGRLADDFVSLTSVRIGEL